MTCWNISSTVAWLLPEHTNRNQERTNSEEKEPDDGYDLCDNMLERKSCHYLGFAEMGFLRPHFVDARSQLFRHSGSLTPPQQRPSGSKGGADCSIL